MGRVSGPQYIVEPETEPQALPASAAPRPALVIQTSFLGDVILTTGLVAELAKRGPVDVLTTPATAPVLANHPAIREVIEYDKHREARGMAALWRTAQHLKGRYGLTREGGRANGREAPVAYLAQGSIRSGMLALLAGFGERVGFASSAARALYTRRVPYRENRHHAERLWWLGAKEGASAPSPELVRPRLYPGASDDAAVDALLSDARYDREPLLVLAPGSAWETKRWPAYPALANMLAREGSRIAVVGTHGDRAAAAAIAEAAGSGVIDATGRLPILATAALIGRAAALVSNDSAPQHLGSAMGTPTVTIYGPTVPEFGFGPLAPRHATAGHPSLPCRPCDRHGPRKCPLGHWRCMRELRVEDVASLVRTVAG